MPKILFIAATLMVALSIAAQQPEPSKRCKYSPDSSPDQIGPGSKQDPPYNFAYVSDYDSDTKNYRRRICDDSTTKEGKVRFDWTITGLGGRCAPGGMLSEETPCASQPETGSGPLKYDLRNIPDSTAYRHESSRCKLPEGTLVSSLVGYVQVADSLVSAALRFTSKHLGNEFSYSIENLSKTPVKVHWKEFSEFWRYRQPSKYVDMFNRLSKEGAVSGNADDLSITIAAKRNAVWSFSFVNSMGEGRFSVVAVYGPEAPEQGGDADLAGIVPLYLPATDSKEKR